MKKIVLALALSMGFAGTAAAADYSYLGASYSASDIENRSSDRYTVEGSLELGPALYVQAGYTNGMDRDFDMGVARVGVGLHTSLTEGGRVDLYGQVSALAVVADREDRRKFNYEAEVGLRNQLTDNFEIRGGVIASNLVDRRFEDVKYFGTVGAEFALTENWKLGLDYLGSSDYNEATLGLRVYF